MEADRRARGTMSEQTVHLKVRRGTAAQGVRVSIVAGENAGTSKVLRQPTVIVGRGQVDFHLSDPTVSSFHLELACDDGGIAVRDLESSNGTFYGGARVERAIVPPGALLQLGTTVIKVEADVPLSVAQHDATAFGRLRGTSRAMRELFAVLGRLAKTDLSVLVEGPTGTGKELAARALHDASRVAQGPFVVLDCTAIPPTLAESALFGHEKGAFTGAAERRAGVFEAADGGTVFLDEIGELPLDLQPKLLRVLEQRQIVRVGSQQPRDVKVRVVSATWHDLRALVNRGGFREDLYYRLAQARVSIPPLRERAEDIPLLARHFIEQIPPHVTCAREISEEALADLGRRTYGGNARELRSIVERAAMMAAGSVITPADLAFERLLQGARAHAPSVPPASAEEEIAITPFKEAKKTLVSEFEKSYLERLLTRAGDNLTRASSIAGVERHYLRELLRKHGLRGEE